MRDYYFRGKDAVTGKWAYGDLIHKDTSGEDIAIRIYEETAFPVHVDPKTVGQFIGKLDRNGVKIFEGDIVKDEHGNTGVIVYSKHFCGWRIVFHKASHDLIGKYGCDIFDWIYPRMTLEVNGNIHDNRELLDGAENEH